MYNLLKSAIRVTLERLFSRRGIFPPMGHLVVSRDIFDYHMDGEEWVSEDTAGIYCKVPGCKML